MMNIQTNTDVSGLRLYRMEPPIVPRSLEERVSPISMAKPDISLEEPARIAKQLETSNTSNPTLSDISSLSSYSFSSSSSSCSCSDSEADSDHNDENDWSKMTECSRDQKKQENRDESKRGKGSRERDRKRKDYQR